jgi:small subunit ribosomal protein S1
MAQDSTNISETQDTQKQINTETEVSTTTAPATETEDTTTATTTTTEPSETTIEKVEEQEEDFAKLLDESFNEPKKRIGMIIKDCPIVEIREDSALIDIKEKSETFLPISELQDNEGNLTFDVNDSIDVVIIGKTKNNRFRVSYKKLVEKEANKKFIDEYINTNFKFDEEKELDGSEPIIVTGTVVGQNKGGYIVKNEDISFFLPKSQVWFSREKAKLNEDLEMEKKITAKVIEMDPNKGSIVISIKQYIADEIRKRNQFTKTLLEDGGQIVQVRLNKIIKDKLLVSVRDEEKNIRVDGYIGNDEITYKRTLNAGELRNIYKIGDTIEAKVIGEDRERRSVALSIKAIYPDPWEEITEALDEGDNIEVTVSNIQEYGAFVDLGNDFEGFLHISEITWDKDIKNPKDYIAEGDKLTVKIIEIEHEKRRLRVSKKALEPKPFDIFRDKYREGDVVKGTVADIVHFGAFIRIDRVEALLHNQDYDWKKGSKCQDHLQKGDEIEVKIGRIESQTEKISLSRKDLIDTPLQIFAKEHKVNDIVKGKVRDVTDFGVFLTINQDVDALIRKEDLYPLKIEELKADLTERKESGSEEPIEIEGVIITLDPHPRRNKLRLSVRKFEREKEKQNLKEFNRQNDDDSGNSLGDYFGDLKMN